VADLRIDLDLHSHAKTRRLVRAYGYHAFYSLTLLWTYAAKHRTDGVLKGMSADDIEAVVEWPADKAGEFVKALLAVGFLDDVNGVFEVHAWRERQPFLADKEARSAAAQKAAQARWNSRANVPEASAAHPDDAERMQNACNPHVDDAERTVDDARSLPDPFLPYPSVSDRSNSLPEEKESLASLAPSADALSLTEPKVKSRSQKRTKKPEVTWPYGEEKAPQWFRDLCTAKNVDPDAEFPLWRGQMESHEKIYRNWEKAGAVRVDTAMREGRTIGAKAKPNGRGDFFGNLAAPSGNAALLQIGNGDDPL
jgi:hypothetical protein